MSTYVIYVFVMVLALSTMILAPIATIASNILKSFLPTCLAYKHVLFVGNRNDDVKQFSTFQSSNLKESLASKENIKMKPNCIFCKISEKSASAEILYEDEEMIIFKDIKPAAKHHYLAISKEHISSAKELIPQQKTLLEKFVRVSKDVLESNRGDINDVRIGFHWPPFHSISHLHMHVISPASEMGFISRQVFRPDTWWFVSVEYVLNRLSNKL